MITALNDFQVKVVHLVVVDNRLADILSRISIDPNLLDEFNRLTKGLHLAKGFKVPLGTK